ncbi:crossover junction endonuclease EME1 [Thalassophryne amazonica]|uniref:crossover junction endonuclease EME1 n=1 Tax=Thalassophryne amazonica TaxID=390379 RepID=UPI001471F88E|nr:crossover junction endonuclease EME1 [Thalassophryne amazonica]
MYSDSSDLEEEFPVCDFLQSGRCHSQVTSDTPDLTVLLEESDREEAPPAAGTGAADVIVMSSDSDDDAPYIPLAQRLKQKQGILISAPSAVSKETDFSSSEPSLQQATTGSHGFLEKYHCFAKGSSTSATRRRPAKSTAEEVQTSREEAEKKRQAREVLKEEQEKQKVERRALAEAAKALRPEESIKHMVVVVDPALLQLEGGATLLASVQALGCSCAIEKQPLPRSVSWRRRSPCAQPDGDECVPEAHVVIQMIVDNFITLIHNYSQEQRLGRSDRGPTLTSWMQERQRSCPDKILSLVVIDLEKYFRSQKSQSQKRFQEAVTGKEQAPAKQAAKKRKKTDETEGLPQVSRVEVEEALVHLQLHAGVPVHFLPTWNDFSDHITMATKAVAEAPFKREREKTGFSFYLESEWAGGQRVDKSGKGLLQVWKRQIQQFHRVSPDMASAIVAAFPSPRRLQQAYSRCKTEQEKMSLLSDLLIRRGEGVTSTTRRVGPELSKRLFLLMNCPDPEQILDSTV